jgi:hypothetical protein
MIQDFLLDIYRIHEQIVAWKFNQWERRLQYVYILVQAGKCRAQQQKEVIQASVHLSKILKVFSNYSSIVYISKFK